jgi:hypothetical protein
MCENVSEAAEPMVDGPSSVIAMSKRLESRLSREVRAGADVSTDGSAV